jgi:Tfp pilus assembly protein PilE
VTLVELLVTITILAILGSAILFASASANRAARVAATRAKVASLHSLLMEKYDEFRTRKVDVQSRQTDWRIVTANRLAGLRMLMRMEMPDRWSDIAFAEIAANPADTGVQNPPIGRTALSQAYLRRFEQIKTATNKATGMPNTGEQITANQGAECLYMIVTLATGDGEAIGLFRQSDIGDTDGDGAPEFLDAWGRPIHYLLAAPGFSGLSDLQADDPDLQAGNPDTRPVTDHDPFDPYRIDATAYRLVPLIYSAGADGDPDIDTQKDFFAMGQKLYEGQGLLVGRPMNDDGDGDNWVDNIHNHEQDVR